MNTKKLGRLEKVDNIKLAWSGEASCFTPWLVDNISLLGKELDLELEEPEVGVTVGSFSTDIHCIANGESVVIENQFNQTDHDHLGKLLTYAAGLKALTVVWVAEKFREEHREAVDWLNEISGLNIHFYGVEIELWKIDGGKPAAKFNVVSKPNARAKAMVAMSDLSDKHKLEFEYWTAFQDFCRNQPESIGLNIKDPPAPTCWMYFPLGAGVSGIAHGNTRVSLNQKTTEVRILLDNRKNSYDNFCRLKEQAEKFHPDLLESFKWAGNPEKKGQYISLLTRDYDPNKKDGWEEQHKWLYEKTVLMRRAFYPLIKKIHGK